jgi:hypothetical protein
MLMPISNMHCRLPDRQSLMKARGRPCIICQQHRHGTHHTYVYTPALTRSVCITDQAGAQPKGLSSTTARLSTTATLHFTQQPPLTSTRADNHEFTWRMPQRLK